MAGRWTAGRGLRRALRAAVGFAGGIGAVAGAQAALLHARYEALPDARGPREGIAVPSAMGPAMGDWPATPLVRDARAFFDREVRVNPDPAFTVDESVDRTEAPVVGDVRAPHHVRFVSDDED